ncbi:MAG: N-formylglutamate deformylase, partial [uncultured Ramlibacter sp.]
DVQPAPGHRAAAGEHAARRHHHPRAPASRLRAARARGGGHRLAPGPPVCVRAAAGRQRASARVLALRHRPQPAAGRPADVPGRLQHRAVPHALLHRRCAVPRERCALAGATRATPRRLLGTVPPRLAAGTAAPEGGTRPCAAVGRAQHSRGDPVAVRRHAARLERRHRKRDQCPRVGHRGGGAGGRRARSGDTRGEWPLQGRLHHAPLRPPRRGRACGAARDGAEAVHGRSAALALRRAPRHRHPTRAARYGRCRRRRLPQAVWL